MTNGMGLREGRVQRLYRQFERSSRRYAFLQHGAIRPDPPTKKRWTQLTSVLDPLHDKLSHLQAPDKLAKLREAVDRGPHFSLQLLHRTVSLLETEYPGSYGAPCHLWFKGHVWIGQFWSENPVGRVVEAEQPYTEEEKTAAIACFHDLSQDAVAVFGEQIPKVKREIPDAYTATDLQPWTEALYATLECREMPLKIDAMDVDRGEPLAAIRGSKFTIIWLP